MSAFTSDIGHFGVDRTNAASAPPRPSKRAPAGGAAVGMMGGVHSVAGMNHNAPAFVPPAMPPSAEAAAAAALWGAPHSHPSSNATPPQSQSPVGDNAAPVQPGGVMPTAAQLEDFKSMVLQMAQFFTQHPEANVVPSQIGNLFSQMSLNPTTSPGTGQPAMLHSNSPTSNGGMHHAAGRSNAPAAGFPSQPFEFMSVEGGSSASPYTASQTTPQRNHSRPAMPYDAVTESAAPQPSALSAFGAPKPNRRAFAQPQQQQQLPSYGSAMAPVPGYDPLLSAFQPDAANQLPSEPLPSFHQHASNGPHRGGSGHARRGGAGAPGPRMRNQGQPFVSNIPDTEPKIIVLVEFKRQRMKKYESDVFVAPGHYVVVEGDRGVDCGFVIHCCIREPDGSFSRQESIDNVQIDVNRIKSESGRVLRLARDDDVKLLHTEIASNELIALKKCRDLATQMNLTMEIVDCEYQFDRKKISFYFDAPHSVDFRELNTELFRVFGVRIWLENLNSKVKNVVPDGALSHADKLQYTKNGLRPPRRT